MIGTKYGEYPDGIAKLSIDVPGGGDSRKHGRLVPAKPDARGDRRETAGDRPGRRSTRHRSALRAAPAKRAVSRLKGRPRRQIRTRGSQSARRLHTASRLVVSSGLD